MAYLCSSIGRKTIVGLTGLALSLFVLSHMAGNLLLFAGAEAYNRYSHALITNPLVYFAEAGLVLVFVLHVYLAVRLTLENRGARNQKYALPTHGQKTARFASKTMIYHGSLLFVFVVLHLATFKYGTHYEVTYDGVVMRDLHRLVVEVFQSPGYVIWYFISMLALGVHLSHGFYSAFASLGLLHPRWNSLTNKLGWIYAWIVALGFISQPIFAFLQ